MSGRKLVPDEHKVGVPTTEDFREVERSDIHKWEVPLSESIKPTMQAPDDWPSPPADVGSDDN